MNWRAGALAAACLLSGCALLALPDVSVARQLLDAGQTQQAQQMLERLVRYEVPEAHRLLGDVHAERGAYGQAADQYRSAARLGDRAAKRRLARLLADLPHLSHTRDCAELTAAAAYEDSAVVALAEGACGRDAAAHWRRNAAQRGSSEALVRLARSGPQGRADALAIAEQRAQRDADGVVGLVRLYHTLGLTEQRDAWLDRAAEPGLAPALRLRLLAYASPERAVALARGIAAEYPLAYVELVKLGLRHPQLIDDATFEADRARAARADPVAMRLLDARNLVWGMRGLQDPEQALALLQGLERDAEAQYLLGQIYRHAFLGEPVPALALQWLNAASRRSMPAATQALAEIYEEGRIVCPDPARARRLRDLAIAQRLSDNDVPVQARPFRFSYRMNEPRT